MKTILVPVVLILFTASLGCGGRAHSSPLPTSPPATPVPITGMWEFSGSDNSASGYVIYLELNLQQAGNQVVPVSSANSSAGILLVQAIGSGYVYFGGYQISCLPLQMEVSGSYENNALSLSISPVIRNPGEGDISVTGTAALDPGGAPVIAGTWSFSNCTASGSGTFTARQVQQTTRMWNGTVLMSGFINTGDSLGLFCSSDCNVQFSILSALNANDEWLPGQITFNCLSSCDAPYIFGNFGGFQIGNYVLLYDDAAGNFGYVGVDGYISGNQILMNDDNTLPFGAEGVLLQTHR